MTLKELAIAELKPCPFCGGIAAVNCIMNEKNCKVIIGCTKCGCTITETLYRGEQTDVKDVIKKWNTRVESDDEK